MTASDWILAADAPARVGRSRATIYAWLTEGNIRTWRPGRKLWLNLPDLLDVERSKTAARLTAAERKLQPMSHAGQ
ncbi:hypothetical protein F8O06_02790 [Pseudoclavibacter sp. CFCC 14310]|uniref:hypothetical protein n=1 Tax=Pseudoclavibacter sp. CFCC 14310 TaxID=2615180 RepID=UPI0013016273|nr:hypothetical protein [Pseudoclavibacter sp. CFCC 14310]KAB1647484.1 hypothetical protein F8O06_02790 [Pseudoclavibacter sp. CFCC 14310]